jgi:hypothetical protein
MPVTNAETKVKTFFNEKKSMDFLFIFVHQNLGFQIRQMAMLAQASSFYNDAPN